MTHALKTWPAYFLAITSGRKNFEVRKNDRPFKEGDIILLQEYDADKKQYTGKEWQGEITYVMNDSEFCKKGFVIMGIKEKESWVNHSAL